MSQQGWTLEHFALVAADFGAWDYDVATGRVSWSPQTAAFFGMPLERSEGTLDDFIARVHPDDRERVKSEIARALGQGPAEFRLAHRVDGALPERWLESHGRVFRDAGGRAVRMAGVTHDCTDHHRAARDEQEDRRLMQAALDASVFAVVVLEPNGTITYCNQLAASLLGLTPSTVQGRSYDAPQWKHTDLDGGPWPDERQPFVRVMKTGQPVFGVEHAIERPDGHRTALRINGQPVKDEHGNIRLLVFSFEDITERHALEASARQSHKMEAVGRLAGGVAHDFNNLLMVISAHAELLLSDMEEDDPRRTALEEIMDATRRGVALTGQLLAFSRKQVVIPVVLDLDALLDKAARMLRRLIGENIQMSLTPSPTPAHVRIDPVQAELVFVNLAVNARDAMPRGGSLTFRTDVVTLGAAAAAAIPGAQPATYARLSVSDTGTGIPAEVLPLVFEPFYTTKPAGRGTGLGLSIVHGIVEQSGGFVTLSSTVGEGTTFRVHLPVTDATLTTAAGTPAPMSDASGETVLIVEDERAVLHVAERLLRREGFRVAMAEAPEDAIRQVREGLEPDLLLTDVVMPGMNGRELHEALGRMVPGLRVVFMSGHTRDVITNNGVLDSGTAFVQKPFALGALLGTIRKALDSKR